MGIEPMAMTLWLPVRRSTHWTMGSIPVRASEVFFFWEDEACVNTKISSIVISKLKIFMQLLFLALFC